MATTQTTVRVGERTSQQWDRLAQIYGDKTKAMAVAIDRLYQTEIPAWVCQQVGNHNYFRIGAFEARDMVQENCPPGWRAHVATFGESSIPEGAILVGHVRVHHGDQPLPLYVMESP